MAEPTETHTVTSGSLAELDLILARMDAQRRAQAAPPKAKAPTLPDPYETSVVMNAEPPVDDGKGIRRRPTFVLEDDKGWGEIPWTW